MRGDALPLLYLFLSLSNPPHLFFIFPVVDNFISSVAVIFVDKNGTEHRVTGKEGQNIVQLAHEHDIELEGACECSLACSTCHIILEPEVYKNLESPVEEEEDLLDLAFGLTSTSRLGCQVLLTTDMNNRKIRLPAATRNFYVDGHKPKPH